MREITIENPTRIVDLHTPMDYIYGLYVRVETPRGDYTATWEHRPSAGCVMLDGAPCRNKVLIASLCKFNKDVPSWPCGCEIPVMGENEADEYLRRNGIPDDDWGTFNNLLAMD